MSWIHPDWESVNNRFTRDANDRSLCFALGRPAIPVYGGSQWPRMPIMGGEKGHVSEVHRAVICRITSLWCGSDSHGGRGGQRYVRGDVQLDLGLQCRGGGAPGTRFADLGRQTDFHIRSDQPQCRFKCRLINEKAA